jgi:type I restriction enzyme S subunit
MKLVPLGTVAEVIAGQSPEGIYYNTNGEGTPFYQGKKEFGDRFLGAPTTWTTKITKLAQHGDILMSVRAPVGPINFSTQQICIGRGLASIRASELVDKNFLFYFLLHKQPEISGNTGAVFDSINKDQIASIEIPLPSIKKQHEIVEKLNGAFAEIDLLEEIHSKSNKELLASLFDTYRDSLLTSACADSPAVEFGEIGNFVRGPFGGSLKKSIFKPSGVAVYEQQHAIYDNFKSFRYFIDDIKYQEMKRFEVKANDLIMSCSGTYGKIAVVPDGSPMGIINQALLKITPDKGVRSQFIKHWMQSSLFQLELEKDIGGAALQNVPSVAKMKSIKIRLPEEEIQIETIEKLDEVQAEIKLAKTVQESIRNNYVALRQSLLSNAFSLDEAVA